MSLPRTAILCGLLLLSCEGNERKLQRDLHSRDPATRAAAARRIASSRGAKAVPILLRLLDDRAPRVRVEAATALGKLRAKSAAKGLGSLVRDRDPRVRLAAVRALARLGRETSEDYLLGAVEDPNRQVRRTARNVLQDLGVPRSQQERRRVVRLVFKHRRDLVHRLPERRLAALKALGRSGRSDVVADLEKLTADSYVNVAEEAAEALGLVGTGRAVGFLEQLSGKGAHGARLAKRGFRALLEAKHPEARGVARRLIVEGDPALRELALVYFLRPGAGVKPLPAMGACLVLEKAARNQLVRWARLLREAKVACLPAAVKASTARLATALTRTGALDAPTVAWLKQQLRAPAEIDVLTLALVLRHSDPALHRAALARVQGAYRRVLEASERWLDEGAWKRIDKIETQSGTGVVPPSRRLPRPAVNARQRRDQQLSRLLSRFPDRRPDLDAELIPPRLGPDRVVRLIRGVALLPAARPWLTARAVMAPIPVRVAALGALGQAACATPACLAAFRAALGHPRPAVRIAGLDAAGRPQAALVPEVIRKLTDPRPRVRAAAAGALGRSAHDKAYPALLAAFRKGRDTYVVEAFATLGDRRAEPVLLAVLREEHAPLRSGDRLAIIETLGRVGTAQSVPRLLPELEHPEPAIRLTTARVLGRIGDRRALEPLSVCGEDFYRAVREACGAARARVKARDAKPAR